MNARQKTMKDANQEDFMTTAEAKSFLSARYQRYLAEEALNKLDMPSFRVVDEVTDYSHFGRMSEKQFEIVLEDLRIARKDNTRAYFECVAKVNRVQKSEEIAY